MKAIGSLLFTLLLITLIGIIGIALFIGWSVGLGWLLMRLTPTFTLFEASLLVMLASFIVGYTAYRLVPPMLDTELEYDEDDLEFDLPIPATRFHQEGIEDTEETWFRYQMANNVYMGFVADSEATNMMSNAQLEALAVRLADIFVTILKRKPRHSQRVSLTIGAVKKEMKKMGQKPYDDDILRLAVGAANVQMSFDDELADVVYEKRWDDVR